MQISQKKSKNFLNATIGGPATAAEV